jgi:regulatory protein
MERCHVAALRILSHRFNSEGELRRKLRSKQFEQETIEATVKRLRNERWIDDVRFAGGFVRTRLKKKIAPQRILRELQAVAVDEEVARQALEQNLEEGTERAAVQELCERRARLLTRRHGEAWLETEEGRTKLALFLLKQGYESSLVWDVLKERRKG